MYTNIKDFGRRQLQYKWIMIDMFTYIKYSSKNMYTSVEDFGSVTAITHGTLVPREHIYSEGKEKEPLPKREKIKTYQSRAHATRSYQSRP